MKRPYRSDSYRPLPGRITTPPHLPRIAILDKVGRCKFIDREEAGIPIPKILGTTFWDWAETEEDAKIAMDCFAACATYRRKQSFALRVDVKGRILKYDVQFHATGIAAAPVLSVAWQVPCEAELLTEREREILQLIGCGLESKQIARKFAISISTVETHRRNAKRKLRCASLAELIAFSVRHLNR